LEEDTTFYLQLLRKLSLHEVPQYLKLSQPVFLAVGSSEYGALKMGILVWDGIGESPGWPKDTWVSGQGTGCEKIRKRNRKKRGVCVCVCVLTREMGGRGG
jgi:hypothetical protein